MADALGYPETPVGWADILRLATQRRRAGRPTATPSGARSGSARPTRTSRPAACPRSSPRPTRPPARPSGLSAEDLDNPTTEAFATGVESAVVHYGDTTLTFLNNWYRTDQRGHVAHLRVGRRRRGEVGHRLQRAATPTASLDPGERAPQAAASRWSPSTRRRARSSPTTRSSSSTRRGSTTTERAGAAPLRGVRPAARRTSARCSSSASGRATPTSRSARRSSRPTASTPTSRRRCSRSRRRR